MDMGIGRLGGSELVFKRKFRWTFEVQNTCGGNVPAWFVKVASRPQLQIEETEVNYLNGKTWIPGKGAWQTMDVTYYDVAAQENQALWSWIASVYQFNDPVRLKQGSKRSDYAGRGILTMYDGCGTSLEKWVLNDMWPTTINFNDLDYSATDICEITLTLRFSGVDYKSLCPGFSPTSCCSPCSGGVGNY